MKHIFLITLIIFTSCSESNNYMYSEDLEEIISSSNELPENHKLDILNFDGHTVHIPFPIELIKNSIEGESQTISYTSPLISSIKNIFEPYFRQISISEDLNLENFHLNDIVENIIDHSEEPRPLLGYDKVKIDNNDAFIFLFRTTNPTAGMNIDLVISTDNNVIYYATAASFNSSDYIKDLSILKAYLFNIKIDNI